jgi:hypothetical protein
LTLRSFDFTSTDTTSRTLGAQKSVAIVGSWTVARNVSPLGRRTSAT